MSYQALRRIGVGGSGAASRWCLLIVVLRICEDECLPKALLLGRFKGVGFCGLSGRGRLLQQGHQVNAKQRRDKGAISCQEQVAPASQLETKSI